MDAFHLAVAEDLLKKHSLVCNVLVDDPQSIVTGSQNEGVPQLAERLERAKAVEGIGGLLGFNEGCRGGGVAPVSCCAVGVWAAIADVRRGVRGEQGVGCRSPGLRVETAGELAFRQGLLAVRKARAIKTSLVKTSLTEGQRAGNGRR